MTTTEATFGQRGEDAPLEPAPAAWLPLTTGDAAVARDAEQAQHGLPSTLFIWLSKLMALGMGIAAVGAILGMVLDTGPLPGELWMVAALAAGAVFQRTLARNVECFTRWGWYGAVAELSFATLAMVASLVADPGSFIGAGFGIAVHVLWLHYFWAQRRDFDIDLDL
ncbi:MAG TPA: hypothetical protein VLK84_29110 [Longimicrobium sp.]|nr:hypothetical protein [Longimicrobium sp.]